MECVILLRWGTPEQKGIDIKRNVFVKKRNREIELRLGQHKPIVIGETRPNKRHLKTRRKLLVRVTCNKRLEAGRESEVTNYPVRPSLSYSTRCLAVFRARGALSWWATAGRKWRRNGLKRLIPRPEMTRAV